MTPVRAAGGVVVRPGNGETEVLLVHRPKYDDWTFPKGKALPGDSDEECALREVEEETGLRCAVDAELPGTEYNDSHGRPKVVRYWVMRPLTGAFEPHEEVDDVSWLPLAAAEGALSYVRSVLRAVESR